VRRRTTNFRTGVAPLWRRLRELLRDRGVDPSNTVLADLFEDDTNAFHCVLVSSEGRVYAFDLVYQELLDPPRAMDMEIENWEELADERARFPDHVSIEAAFAVLDEDRNRGI